LIPSPAADTILTMASYPSRTRRFSRTEYERLIDLGVFQPGKAIELIGGEVVVAEPQGAAHYTALVKAPRVLERPSDQAGTRARKGRSGSTPTPNPSRTWPSSPGAPTTTGGHIPCAPC